MPLSVWRGNANFSSMLLGRPFDLMAIPLLGWQSLPSGCLLPRSCSATLSLVTSGNRELVAAASQEKALMIGDWNLVPNSIPVVDFIAAGVYGLRGSGVLSARVPSVSLYPIVPACI